MRAPILLLPLVTLLSACAGPTVYVHPNADLGSIQRVAILPFETVSQDRFAAEKVTNVFLTELLSLGAFEVVEPGLVLRTLRDERVEALNTVTPADVKRIAKAMGAQGLFFGTVVDFAEGRGGSTGGPEVTIQLRLVEGESGITVWSASRTHSGTGLGTRLFGIGGRSTTEIARALIREELETLSR